MSNSTAVFTPASLATSAQEISQELLMVPQLELSTLLPYMSVITGINGKLIIGEVDGDFELAKYSTSENDGNFDFRGRTLEVELGSLIHKFDPNELYKSEYNKFVKGNFENLPFADFLLMIVVKKISNKLYRYAFSADKSAVSGKTAKLFDGFDTIAKAEIAAGNISVTKGNQFDFSAPITSVNALEMLLAFYRAASPELKDVETVLYLDPNIYDMYLDDYANTHGGANFTQKFEQPVLVGSSGKCKLVPLSAKAGSPYIQLTTVDNMAIGFDGEGNMNETVTIEKHHPFLYDFVAKMAIGMQYRQIAKEALLIGKLNIV